MGEGEGYSVRLSRVRLPPRRVALKARASFTSSVFMDTSYPRLSAPRTAQRDNQLGNKRKAESTETVTRGHTVCARRLFSLPASESRAEVREEFR
ncbi:uncharacterized [Tachysurus ichikawai]